MIRYVLPLALLVAAALWFVLDGPMASNERVAPTVGADVHRPLPEADLAAPETRGERSTNEAESESFEDQVGGLVTAAPVAALDASTMRLVVLDAGGAPVPGAHVETSWRKGWGDYDSEHAVADAAGVVPTTLRSLVEFEIIEVSVPNSERTVTDQHDDLVVDPNEPRVVRVAIGAQQTLSVRVLDLGGRPVPKAHVELEHGAPSDLGPFVNVLSSSPTELRVQADDAGRVEVDVDLGTWRIDVIDGSSLGETYVDLVDAEGRTEAVVRALSPADGRSVLVEVVVAESGGRVGVWAIGRMPTSDDSIRVEAEPSEDGSFELRIPRAGTWTVHASSRAYGKANAPLANDVDHLRLVIPPKVDPAPLAPLIGRVISAEDGAPLRATVTTTHNPSLRSRSVGPRSHFEGDFELPRPRRGGVYLQASSDGFVDRFVGPIGLDDLGPFEVQMDVRRRIEGRVLDANGEPVGCMVLVDVSDQIIGVDGSVNPSGRFLTRTKVTYPPGEFRIDHASSAPHRITAVPKDKSLAPAVVVASGGDEDLVITLGEGIESLATLRGRIVDAVSGRAVEGIRVRVEAREGRAGALSYGLSDADGAYAAQGILPGRYDVIASPDAERELGYTFTRVDDVELLEGETILDVEVLRARTLHLAVVDAQGEPLRRVGLAAEDESGSRLAFQDRYGNSDGFFDATDAAGRAILTGLPATQVVIHVLDDDREPIHSSEVDLTSPRREVLRLVVPR